MAGALLFWDGAGRDGPQSQAHQPLEQPGPADFKSLLAAAAAARQVGIDRLAANRASRPPSPGISVEPKARKAIKFTDSLVEVVYICESCGTEIKRTIREK
jgi:hypothetical protein